MLLKGELMDNESNHFDASFLSGSGINNLHTFYDYAIRGLDRIQRRFAQQLQFIRCVNRRYRRAHLPSRVIQITADPDKSIRR